MKTSFNKSVDRGRKIASALGFDPEMGFVTLSQSGCVGFTCGKPEEIRELRSAAKIAGYKITRSLKNANC
jgi:hypothetical protein